MKLSTLTLQYVKVPVTAEVSGAAIDPTGDAVQMAFPVRGVKPVTNDWKTASWETMDGTYLARCLVGPGGTVTLGVGLYDVHVKITDSPEIVVDQAPGVVEIV